MKKLIAAIVFFVLICTAVSGQDYKTGIGIRLGSSNGITLKHFIAPNIAMEGLFTVRYGGYNITGLYEIHAEPFSISNLYFYYGFGGHLGSWHTYHSKPWWDDSEYHSVIGIDGIAGFEYNFGNIPLNLSLDLKPAINIIGYPTFWLDEFSLSIRYVWGNR
jgi:hypothetical protein